MRMIFTLKILLIFGIAVSAQENLKMQLEELHQHMQQMQKKMHVERLENEKTFKMYQQQIADLELVLNKKAPRISEQWIAIQCATDQLAGRDGKIDSSKLETISTQMATKLKKQYPELSITAIIDKNLEENKISEEQKQMLARLAESSTWSKASSGKNWYSRFDIVIDQSMMRSCPYGDRWVYIKSRFPNSDGTVKEIKLKLFKRYGIYLEPYTKGEYKVEILSYGNSGHNSGKIVRVKGVNVYLNLNQISNQTAKNITNRTISLDLFFDRRNQEYPLTDDGIKPHVIDFDIHHKSVIFLHLKGSNSLLSQAHKSLEKKIAEDNFGMVFKKGLTFSTYRLLAETD